MAARVRRRRVFDAGLLLLHLGFGSRTDLDNRYAADQLGKALLQLPLLKSLVVVDFGGIAAWASNFLFDAAAVNDGRVVLDPRSWPGPTAHGNILELLAVRALRQSLDHW